MDGYGKGGRMTPPVNVGDELDVKIEAVGEKGDGIAKKDGFVLFVPGVKEGDEVRVRVTKVLRRVGFAEVVGEGAPKSEEEEAPAEEAPAEEPAEEETPSEDTEDFGEEEAPAEEEPEADMPPLPEEEEAPAEEEPSEEEAPAEEPSEEETEE
ncbi:TRAM domain-containing protein [Candidatus Woesearchaeota archaeon]|nr:TRAM domain-containing protein [Candidatus Woesearchaeota archaeon]